MLHMIICTKKILLQLDQGGLPFIKCFGHTLSIVRYCWHCLVASTTKYRQKQQEDANDIHVQNQGCKDVLLWTQLVLLATHHQLHVIGKELLTDKYWMVNPLHPNISVHILLTVSSTFPKVPTRRIYSTTKSLFSWWSFPLFSWTYNFNVILGETVRNTLVLGTLRDQG